ncbi:MAG: DMT family transporter [Myxococcota bacterium]
MSFDYRSRLDIAGAALLFSTGGAAIKMTALSGWSVAAGRSLIAAAVFFAVFPAARKGYTRRTVLVSLCYAATLTLFVLSTKMTTAANAIFLQSTAPLYVMVAAPLMLREAFRRYDLLIGAAIAGGLLLILSGSSSAQPSAPNPTLGNALAASCGLSWAATLMGLRWLAREGSQDGGVAAVTLGNVFTVAVCLPFVLAEERVGIRSVDLAALLYLGIFQVAAPYALLTRGLRMVPAFTAGLIILIEPALNPVWAFLINGERVGLLSIAGGVLILCASAAKSAAEARPTVAPQHP